MKKVKFKIKDFLHKNEGKIKKVAKVGIGIIVVGTEVFFIIENRKKSNLINRMRDTILAQNERINELKDLCERKDANMCSLMSKALRQGCSEGGRQMVYRKHYLQQNKILTE